MHKLCHIHDVLYHSLPAPVDILLSLCNQLSLENWSPMQTPLQLHDWSWTTLTCEQILHSQLCGKQLCIWCCWPHLQYMTSYFPAFHITHCTLLFWQNWWHVSLSWNLSSLRWQHHHQNVGYLDLIIWAESILKLQWWSTPIPLNHPLLVHFVSTTSFVRSREGTVVSKQCCLAVTISKLPCLLNLPNQARSPYLGWLV